MVRRRVARRFAVPRYGNTLGMSQQPHLEIRSEQDRCRRARYQPSAKAVLRFRDVSAGRYSSGYRPRRRPGHSMMAMSIGEPSEKSCKETMSRRSG